MKAVTDHKGPRPSVAQLSRDWLDKDIGAYLDRCQIDTPDSVVAATWDRVLARRPDIGCVLDFGAGDGRFARTGRYRKYVGFEVDWSRSEGVQIPSDATILHQCAFASGVADADLCIGNPPFVRNQDLPEGWRARVVAGLQERSGVTLSGLANAWQYFFLLGLLSTADDGMCALVIPYEWVSRPSVRPLREYIKLHGWDVDVFRLADEPFESVLTTASITIVDKRSRSGRWRFYETGADMVDHLMPTASGGAQGHISYLRLARTSSHMGRAVRGLSPGTQRVLVLTEGERARLGLKPGRDVVRCVTSLRALPANLVDLDVSAFDTLVREQGRKCWLINSETAAGEGPLRAYLDSVEPKDYATHTCLDRGTWWNFVMPATPTALIATCFKGRSPKAVLNSAGAVAVGGVAGIHGSDAIWSAGFLRYLSGLDLRYRIVSHANDLLKLEIGQLNTLICEYTAVTTDG